MVFRPLDCAIRAAFDAAAQDRTARCAARRPAPGQGLPIRSWSAESALTVGSAPRATASVTVATDHARLTEVDYHRLVVFAPGPSDLDHGGTHVATAPKSVAMLDFTLAAQPHNRTRNTKAFIAPAGVPTTAPRVSCRNGPPRRVGCSEPI